jgi:hypothetical protein
MKLRISFLSILFLFSLGHTALSQWYPVTVEINTGQFIEGKTFIFDEQQAGKVKFKSLNVETEHVAIISTDDINSLTYQLENGEAYFKKVLTYKNSRNNTIHKKPSFVQVLYEGDNISLYVGYNPLFKGNTATGEFLKKNYYLIRPSEEAASFLGSIRPNSENSDFLDVNFIDFYFEGRTNSNWEELNEEFSEEKLLEFVREYDQ